MIMSCLMGLFLVGGTVILATTYAYQQVHTDYGHIPFANLPMSLGFIGVAALLGTASYITLVVLAVRDQELSPWTMSGIVLATIGVTFLGIVLGDRALAGMLFTHGLCW